MKSEIETRREKTETVSVETRVGSRAWETRWNEQSRERREEGSGETAMPSLGLYVYFLTLSSVAALSIFTSGRRRPPM